MIIRLMKARCQGKEQDTSWQRGGNTATWTPVEYPSGHREIVSIHLPTVNPPHDDFRLGLTFCIRNSVFDSARRTLPSLRNIRHDARYNFQRHLFLIHGVSR